MNKEEQITEKGYYFTFGSGQRCTLETETGNIRLNENTSIFIPDLDFSTARKKMFKVFGSKWCGQYDQDQWREIGWGETVEMPKGIRRVCFDYEHYKER